MLFQDFALLNLNTLHNFFSTTSILLFLLARIWKMTFLCISKKKLKKGRVEIFLIDLIKLFIYPQILKNWNRNKNSKTHFLIIVFLVTFWSHLNHLLNDILNMNFWCHQMPSTSDEITPRWFRISIIPWTKFQ